MKIIRFARSLILLASAALAPATASAQVAWTDWLTLNYPDGTASGTMGGVTVNYVSTGPVQAAYTDCTAWPAADRWAVGNGAYTNGTVPNRPICDQIGFTDALTATVTFSSPVSNLYMAMLSVGQRGTPVTFAFNQSFVVDSWGMGFSGSDWNGPGIVSGNSFTGEEFHGVLRFTSPVTTLTFTTNVPEHWQGFTFGAAPVPEPASASLTLVGAALLGAGALSRRRTSVAVRA
jgi:hypothetical protein